MFNLIGVMIGAYIVMRAVETAAGTQNTSVRALAVATLIVASFCTVGLFMVDSFNSVQSKVMEMK